MKSSKLPIINRSINAAPVWYQQNGGDFPTSEQRAEFVAHKMTKSVGFSPRNSVYRISKIPFDDFSEQRANFVNYSIKNRNFIRRRDQIQLSKMPIVSSTNYADDFKNKDSVKLTPYRPIGSQLEFVFKDKENIPSPMASQYRSDYQTFEAGIANKLSLTFSEKFPNNQGSSTDYQANFQQKPSTRIYLPYPVYRMPQVPFATDTSYNSTFVKHPYAKEGMIMPAKSNLTVDSSATTDSISTYKTDFIKKDRDNVNDDLNIRQNNASLSQTITHYNWYEKVPSEHFNEYRRHVFYQT